ncbi:hypothetical protein GMA19_01509 [Paenibacillus polymyxa E681]|uniref:DUF3139 domain-containing protein n=1 Tax=Paenibacillus polymyxa TaxID=1406 RepID=UPI0001E31797|nr:DUF3139 domain-containing protein [Paenibacillus polymyxa]ADM69341.1 hypothetical protein PPE_01502 [Paenibacillus polymyxa E681]QNV56348.1 hypothetical protein GE561_01509 [Paenibacillus polymyxa E681]QNV61185.1 hypothetical protein GMA19_01509 [Paenibacillus polymyxa E681]
MKKHGIAIFIVILFASIWILSSYTKSHTQSEVFNYLVKIQGYKPSEICSVETKIAKAPLISTQVIFKDETNTGYFYKKERGKIIQYNQAPVKGVDDGTYNYKHHENK